jgi:hypothetical protein
LASLDSTWNGQKDAIAADYGSNKYYILDFDAIEENEIITVVLPKLLPQ